jgi:hypothetical protein
MARESRRSGRVFVALLMAAVAVVAFLAGVLTERMRFDGKRDEMLRRYNRALEQHRQQIMQSEKAQP